PGKDERSERSVLGHDHQLFAQFAVLRRHFAWRESLCGSRDPQLRCGCIHGDVRTSIESIEVGTHRTDAASGAGVPADGGGSRSESPARMTFGSLMRGFKRRTAAIRDPTFAPPRFGP